MPDGQTEWERKSAHDRGECYPGCEHHRISMWPIVICLALLCISFGGGACLLVRIFGGL